MASAFSDSLIVSGCRNTPSKILGITNGITNFFQDVGIHKKTKRIWHKLYGLWITDQIYEKTNY